MFFVSCYIHKPKCCGRFSTRRDRSIWVRSINPGQILAKKQKDQTKPKVIGFGSLVYIFKFILFLPNLFIFKYFL